MRFLSLTMIFNKNVPIMLQARMPHKIISFVIPYLYHPHLPNHLHQPDHVHLDPFFLHETQLFGSIHLS